MDTKVPEVIVLNSHEYKLIQLNILHKENFSSLSLTSFIATANDGQCVYTLHK